MSLDISQFHPPELTPDALELLLKILGAFVLYGPSLLGLYLGYSVTSNVSLHYWIAAQHVPAPKAGHEAPKTKSHTMRLILATYIGGFLVYSVGYLGGPFAWWSLLLLPLTWISTLAFVFAANKVPFSVHRTKDGTLTLAGGPKTFGARFFAGISLYLSVWALRGANTGHNPQSLSMIGFVGITYLCCTGGGPKAKISGLIGQNFIHPSYYVFVAVRMIFEPEFRIKFLETIDKVQASPTGNSVVRAIVLPFIGVFVGQLLAILLRFDYTRFIENHPEVLDSNPLIIEAVPLTTLEVGKSKAVEDGVQLPTELPFKFSRKYYRSAFATWFVTLSSFMIGATLFFPDLGEFVVMFSAMYTSLITTATATLFVAVCCGEFRKLWSYTEDWKLAPVPVVVEAAQVVEETRSSEKKEVDVLILV